MVFIALKIKLKTVAKSLCYCLLFFNFLTLQAASIEAPEKAARSQLEWGSVLFDYYQKDYFAALVEYEYAKTIDNSIAQSVEGRLLNGGMMLSYGLADESEQIFKKVLAQGAPKSIQNRAWFYLANLFYHKSRPQKAFDSLSKIAGKVPRDLHPQYHYLATLVSHSAEHIKVGESVLNTLPPEHPHYPYIVFNLAIQRLGLGDVADAVNKLRQVVEFQLENQELATLADRAKHGLAQISLQQGDNLGAWNYLTSVRTNGLYSNRALLTYAWTAIKFKQFNDAIAALEILNSRSIALPEVQESKVLLAHLYEQQEAPRKALKANLLAIDAFAIGINQVAAARKIIAKQEVPKEFIQNLEAIVDDSDWFGAQPSVDYQKLTPFLIDLMSSKVLNEALKELSDLYAIQRNLVHWQRQAKEHELIINNAQKKSIGKDDKALMEKSQQMQATLADKKAELKLHALTLSGEDQKRFKALIENTENELGLLTSKVERLAAVERPYQQPAVFLKEIKQKHLEINKKLAETQGFIKLLEPVVRSLVNAELDKHEERMRYYWAQSRLAKARLYDTTLMNLDKAKKKRQIESPAKTPEAETPEAKTPQVEDKSS